MKLLHEISKSFGRNPQLGNIIGLVVGALLLFVVLVFVLVST